MTSSRMTTTSARSFCAATFRRGAACASTLDDLREAVTKLEDVERTARQVFGGAHPFRTEIEKSLRESRAVLRARETPPK